MTRQNKVLWEVGSFVAGGAKELKPSCHHMECSKYGFLVSHKPLNMIS